MFTGDVLFSACLDSIETDVRRCNDTLKTLNYEIRGNIAGTVEKTEMKLYWLVITYSNILLSNFEIKPRLPNNSALLTCFYMSLYITSFFVRPLPPPHIYLLRLLVYCSVSHNNIFQPLEVCCWRLL